MCCVNFDEPTYKLITGFDLENFVIDRFVLVEVERLERVEQEIAHVLVHVGLHHAPIEVIDNATAVHDLIRGCQDLGGKF